MPEYSNLKKVVYLSQAQYAALAAKDSDTIYLTPDNFQGGVYIPQVDKKGNLSWSNNKGLENPPIINIMGLPGIQGPAGEKGADGINGLDYKGIFSMNTTYNRSDVVTSAEGNVFICYVDGTRGISPPASLTSSTNWAPFAAKGADGREGEQGPRGSVSEQGPPGPQGEPGPVGGAGPTGPAGPQGIQGIQGLVGPQGPQGQRGLDGPQGDRGPVGSQGPQGLTGQPGPQGPQGLPGPAGAKGTDGLTFNFRSVYANGNTYSSSTNDAVSSGGYLWMCIGTNVKNTAPPTWPNTNNSWAPIGFVVTDSSGGTGGGSGEQGPPGPMGPQGPVGPAGSGTDVYHGIFVPMPELGNNGDLFFQQTDETAGNKWLFLNAFEGAEGRVQTWTAPKTKRYKFDLAGACGAVGNNSFHPAVGTRGGYGARLYFEYDLNEGDVLHFVVGQKGTTVQPNPPAVNGTAGGSGGATFVLREINAVTDSRYQFTKSGKAYEVMAVAAGGGGTRDISYYSGEGNSGSVGTYYNGLAANSSTYNPVNYANGITSSAGVIYKYINSNINGTTYQRGNGLSVGGYGGGLSADDAATYGGAWYGSYYSWCVNPVYVGLDGYCDGHGYLQIEGDATASFLSIYFKKDGVWTQIGRVLALKGEKGDRGDIGLTGAGSQGPVGATGAKGDKGDKGDTGSQGPQGVPGAQGPAGAQGARGEQGPKGDTGQAAFTMQIDSVETLAAGQQAYMRNTGTVEDQKYSVGIPQGPRGVAGERGEKGEQGPQGVMGQTGPRGPQGEQGEQGPAGKDGSGMVEWDMLTLREDGFAVSVLGEVFTFSTEYDDSGRLTAITDSVKRRVIAYE